MWLPTLFPLEGWKNFFFFSPKEKEYFWTGSASLDATAAAKHVCK